ncbi:MAG TPA: hypothetical protein VF736_00260 [Pyrinomonadaceae bacterium]|jgi:F0F1-type ATP synthase membrane subunit c/vacuolar-type H+-ATPase subunit K
MYPMLKEPDADANPALRLRVMRILWAAFLMTIGLFLLVTYFVRPSADAAAEVGRENPVLLAALAAIGLSTVVASFFVKAGFYRRAAERQEPAVLQTGFIVALALCEAAVILGMVGLFATWSDYAYLLFGLGALGEALHFPRREQVMSAYYRPAG